MKTFIFCSMILACSSVAFAGECLNGQCNLRSTTKQVVRTVTRPVRRVVEVNKSVTYNNFDSGVNHCANGKCRSKSVTIVR
jgi:hypothetical protein